MTNQTDVISVLLACNANYAPHAAACMASLLRHSQASFEFLIVATGDPAPFADRIRRSFAGHPRATVEVRRFEVPAGTHFPTPNGLTLETYVRFWIGDLLPHRSRALYIDSDTIATVAIDPLWQTDLRGNVLAAVPIPGSTRPETHGMPAGSLFFNAGVLLIDLDAWRQRNYRDRCLDYLRRHPERAIDGDQDILNLCAIGDWLVLPFEWNVINPFYRPSHDMKLSASAVRGICRDARIIHFNGTNKPWNYLDNHPRKADYLKNLAATDWRDWRPADRTPFNIVRKQVSFLLPAWCKRGLRALAEAVRRPSAMHSANLPAAGTK